MMNKLELLGLSAHQPPPNLAQGAKWKNADEYTAYLRAAAADADGTWMRAAIDVAWQKIPGVPGRPGAWFEGGILSLAHNCLTRHVDADPGLEVVTVLRGDNVKTSVSRERLLAWTRAVAARLLSVGIRQGDHVLVCAPPGPALVAAVLAVTGIGAVCVPIDTRRSDGDISRRYKDARCKVALVAGDMERCECLLDRSALMNLDEAIESRANDGTVVFEPCSTMHPAFVLADSSGQLLSVPTGGFLVGAVMARRHLLLGDSPERLWVASPSHHVSHLAAVLGTLTDGGTVGLVDNSVPFASTLQVVGEAASDGLLLVDAKLALLAVEETAKGEPMEKGPGPALLIVEGETLEPRIYNALRNTLFHKTTHVVQVLARPEVGGFVAGPNPRVCPIRPSSVALPAPGLDLCVVDSKGDPCAPNMGGLLALRRATPGLAREMQGSTPPIPLQVKARLDRNGMLWTMGEAKVVIEMKQKVGTAEIEALLAETPGVEQVAVVRYQDASGKSGLRAFVKFAVGETPDTEALADRVRERFGEDAMPETFQVVQKLPHSRSGKLLRSVLQRISAGEPMGLDDASLVTDPTVVEGINRDSH